MYDTGFHFDQGQRVRLRDGIDPSFYDGMAKVGNEGWIAERRKDTRYGLPEIFIRWDRDHWADNRQPDCWTFQEHFEPVEDKHPMTDPNENTPARDMNELFKEWLAHMTDDQDGNEPPPISDDEYAGMIEKATALMRDSEAFLTVFVSRQDDDDAPQGLLAAGAIGDSKVPEAEALMGAQLSQLAARFHQEAVVLNVKTLSERDHDQ